MHRLIAVPIIALALATLPAAAGAQQAAAGDVDTTSIRPAPAATPWSAVRAPSDTALAGPRLPTHVHPAAVRAFRDDAAPAAPDKIVIPVTTAVIVLAVVVLILLID